MAAEKKYSWHKIAESPEELPWEENQLCEIIVKGKTICLAKKEAQVFACAHKCPHAGGHLADGFVDALGNIVFMVSPMEVELSNVAGVGPGWRCSIFSRVVRRGMASLQP